MKVYTGINEIGKKVLVMVFRGTPRRSRVVRVLDRGIFKRALIECFAHNIDILKGRKTTDPLENTVVCVPSVMWSVNGDEAYIIQMDEQDEAPRIEQLTEVKQVK